MKPTHAAVISLVATLFAALWWPPPNKSGPENPTVYINHASQVELLPIDGAFGPESIAFDPAGEGPYVGVSDGRVLKWNPHGGAWDNFSFTSPNRDICERPRDHELTEHTCGRPLGMCFHVATGNLYIADSYMGLLVVGPKGGPAHKVQAQEDIVPPFGLINGLDIDQNNGVIYFTDSTTHYKRRNYLAAFLAGDNTGRLMKYELRSKRFSVLVKNLKFPNGVSLSKDRKSVLVVESISCKVLRYWLDGTSKVGFLETVVELPGFPDNIKRNENGEFWVGVYTKKTRLSEFVFSRPRVGNFIARSSTALRVAQVLARMKVVGMGFKLNEKGEILEVLEDQSGSLKFLSEVMENHGRLYFGSVIFPYVGVLTKQRTI